MEPALTAPIVSSHPEVAERSEEAVGIPPRDQEVACRPRLRATLSRS